MELVRVSDQDLQVSYYPIRGRSVRVIRDDYLPHGTKQRGYAYFQRLADIDQTAGVSTSAAPTGYGQVALAYMAQLAGLKAYIFINYYPTDDRLILWAKSYGATYVVIRRKGYKVEFDHPVSNITIEWEDNYKSGVSTIYQADVSARMLADSIGLSYISLGLHEEGYIGELTDSITRASINWRYFTGVDYPKRLWLAVGSGTILESLTRVWPNTHFMCVQVGKNIREVLAKLTNIKTTLFESPYKFDKAIPDEELPPYDSLETYDAKIWPFVLEFGEDDDFIWNVAGSVKYIPPKSSVNQDWGRRRSKVVVNQDWEGRMPNPAEPQPTRGRWKSRGSRRR